MSTNPFDIDYQPTKSSRLESRRPTSISTRNISHASSRQQKQQTISPKNIMKGLSPTMSTSELDPIWEARGVEWPLVSCFNLPSSRFKKLYKQSKMAGNSLGIVFSYNSASGGFIGSSNTISGGDKIGKMGVNDGDVADGIGMKAHGSNNGEKYYGGLGGFMGKLIGSQNQNMIVDEVLDVDTNINTTRKLHPPRSHCIASANGWIMAAVESSPISTSVPISTGTNNTISTMSNSQALHQLPQLRLMSRWNVRRGSSNDSHSVDGGLIPLPPPVTATNLTLGTIKNKHIRGVLMNPISAGRIMHVFVDPTGCHTIISAQNGEAYYTHTLSMNKVVRKLKGFGPNVEGTFSCVNVGCSLSDLPVNCNPSKKKYNDLKRDAQLGTTPGSYITSVGWDRKRGTEGSTHKILLGNNFGEVYEYSLNATLSSDTGSGSNDDAKGGTEFSAVLGDDNLPILLIRLNAGENPYGRIREDDADNTKSGVVSGLHFERLRGGAGNSSDSDDQADMIVLAVTSGVNKQTRLHTYLSTPSSDNSKETNTPTAQLLQDHSVFHRVFASDAPTSRRSFIELPGCVNYADLKICEDDFAMRTETGIYYGSIDKSNSVVGPISKGSSGIVDAGMFPYENSSLPVAIAITPHHFITLSGNGEVRFISRVAKKTIQKERVDWATMSRGAGGFDDGLHDGVSNDLIMDVRRPNQAWLWKSRALIHLTSSREDRDVWKFSLEACLSDEPKMSISTRTRSSHYNDEKYIDAKFDTTKAICTNNIQKAVVTAARAKYHLAHNRVELAAKYMAQCPSELMPFVETCIELSNSVGGRVSGNNAGLISYLLHKMQYYKARNDNVVCTMLGAWLVELYLHERERNGSFDVQVDGSNTSQPHSHRGNNLLLQQFLSSNAYNMDAKTILRILCSHDATATECASYASSSGDIGTAVNAALCTAEVKNGALDALRVLGDTPIEQAESYYYRHAFILLCRAPLAASKSFLARFSHGLSATKLLPAFMRYEKTRLEKKDYSDKFTPKDSVQISGSQSFAVELSIDARGTFDQSQFFVDDSTASIAYFEGAITLGCRSTAVFNYLVSLYVNMDDEMPLFDFVSKHISLVSTLPGIQPKQISPLDMNYTLSSILQSGRHFRSAIKLYMGLGMRFRAVELAIKVDPVLAKQLASESVERDEQKRLWSMIARNAAMEGESVGGNEIVSKVLSILNECGPDILSIEDVLPFLPDVAQIDQFKDEICAALTSYSSKIDEYLKEMSTCDETCNSLREDIRRLNNFTTSMGSEARCAYTGKVVADANEPFYVFPSGYIALEGALKQEVVPYLNVQQRTKVESIEKEINDLKGGQNISHSGDVYWEKSDQEYKLEALQLELDGLIAAECPLTGSIMIESIDHCFADSKEDELYIVSDDLMMEA